MVSVREKYGKFNGEILNLQHELNQKVIPLAQERRDEIKEEIEVYTRVRDKVALHFKDYKVENINQLSMKIREFRAELEHMERHNQREAVHATQQEGQSSQGQEQPRKLGHKELLDNLLREHGQKNQDRDKDRGHER